MGKYQWGAIVRAGQHPAVESFPLYKAVDTGKRLTGRRVAGVVVEIDYRPASPLEVIEAALDLLAFSPRELGALAQKAGMTIDEAGRAFAILLKLRDMGKDEE